MKTSRFLLAALPFLLIAKMAGAAVQIESRAQPSWEGSQAASNDLELLKKMEFLQQEVQELRGKVEEQNYLLQQMQDHQKKLYLDLDRRLKEGAQSASTSSNTTITNSGISFDEQPPAAAPVSTSPTEVTNPNADDDSAAEEKLYQQAYRYVQIKDFDNALNAFQTQIKTYPKGKYYPNAQYWLGEIYLVKGNIDLAHQAFTLVYQSHTQHPKAADCLLKLGYIAYSKSDFKQAKEFFSQVKAQYPGSTSAQLAESRLQKMSRDGA